MFPWHVLNFTKMSTLRKTVRDVMAYRMISKISGRAFSRSFIRSFMAATIVLALSSAPCLLLFSAAPVNKKIVQNLTKGS